MPYVEIFESLSAHSTAVPEGSSPCAAQRGSPATGSLRLPTVRLACGTAKSIWFLLCNDGPFPDPHWPRPGLLGLRSDSLSGAANGRPRSDQGVATLFVVRQDPLLRHLPEGNFKGQCPPHGEWVALSELLQGVGCIRVPA